MESYSRFGNSGKLRFSQPVYCELPVTECRQKHNLCITYEEKVNPSTSKTKPEKGKAVLERANIALFAPAESSENIHSQTNFIP